MDAWGRSVDAGDKVLLLADGSALFTKAKPVVKAPEPAPKKGGLFSFGKKQQPAN